MLLQLTSIEKLITHSIELFNIRGLSQLDPFYVSSFISARPHRIKALFKFMTEAQDMDQNKLKGKTCVIHKFLQHCSLFD